MDNKKQYFRTDLAYEEFENEIHTDGYSYKKTNYGDIKCNHVKILDKENAFKRVVGDYIGIEFESIDFNKDELIDVCVKQLDSLLPKSFNRVLVVGLGNKEVIADALGNEVCKQLFVNAHLHDEKQVAVITPGVKGQTGLETVSYVQSIVNLYKPDIVIAIDALATKDIKRLNRVIQITNTGIQPGSGIGNYQKSLDKSTLNVEVIAIGVSTVIDIVSIVSQIVDDMSDAMYQLIQEEYQLTLTPKEMDYELLSLTHILSKVINTVLFANI